LIYRCSSARFDGHFETDLDPAPRTLASAKAIARPGNALDERGRGSTRTYDIPNGRARCTTGRVGARSEAAKRKDRHKLMAAFLNMTLGDLEQSI